MRYEKLRGYSEEWWVITRDTFDLEILDEPHHSLAMLVNTRYAQFIFRVLGTTRYYMTRLDIELHFISQIMYKMLS